VLGLSSRQGSGFPLLEGDPRKDKDLRPPEVEGPEGEGLGQADLWNLRIWEISSLEIGVGKESTLTGKS
jgi:hypothetical protein